jgi:hypothetical protein
MWMSEKYQIPQRFQSLFHSAKADECPPKVIESGLYVPSARS